FTVNSFTPRPGTNYAVSAPNGDYRYYEGDFNGDGKTDLVHVPADGYIHVWLSNGDGTFDVQPALTAPDGASQHYAAGDFNGDGKTDLLHQVTGQQYCDVWFSNGDGTFTMGPAQTYEGFDSFFALDHNGDGLADLLHFRGGNAQFPPNGENAQFWLSKRD